MFSWKKLRKTEKSHEILDRAIMLCQDNVTMSSGDVISRNTVTQSWCAGENFGKSHQRNFRNLLWFRSYAQKVGLGVNLPLWFYEGYREPQRKPPHVYRNRTGSCMCSRSSGFLYNWFHLQLLQRLSREPQELQRPGAAIIPGHHKRRDSLVSRVP